jgi:F-type H+/Na+-transporting ATPase subunit alpha
VVAIYAGVNGYLDEIPVGDVPRFLGELRDHLRAEESVLKEIRDTGDLSDELQKKIEGELDKFVKGFKTSEEPAAA